MFVFNDEFFSLVLTTLEYYHLDIVTFEAMNITILKYNTIAIL